MDPSFSRTCNAGSPARYRFRRWTPNPRAAGYGLTSHNAGRLGERSRAHRFHEVDDQGLIWATDDRNGTLLVTSDEEGWDTPLPLFRDA
jgi:hypothetical protein